MSKAVVDTPEGDLDATSPSIGVRVAAVWDDLTKAERAVARFLAATSPETLVFATAEELGRQTGTSDATVVRTAQRLGYSGLPELKREISFSALPTQTRLRRRLSDLGHDASLTISRVFDEAKERLDDARDGLSSADFESAVRLIAGAGDVIAFGWGASEIWGRYFALKLNRMGIRARFVGATGFSLADELLSLAKDTVVVVLAPGRLLPDLLVVIEHARAVGARRILFTESLGPRLATDFDVTLHTPTSATGITAEALTAVVVTDAILLATAGVHEERAIDTSHLLGRLRDDLVEPGPEDGDRADRS